MSKDPHNLKREQEEEKTKQILEERNREREMDRNARERVRQQIAMVIKTFILHNLPQKNDNTMLKIKAE